jgi:outer membrane lipoprotein-sorting protein
MTKKDWLVLTTFIVILGTIGGITFLSNVIHLQSVNASTGVEEALTFTLISHNKWETVLGDAHFTFYGPRGETQTYVDRFVISNPNKAYIESISLDGKGQNTAWISDGVKIYSLDESSKIYQIVDLPQFSQNFSKLPEQLSEVSSDTVYHHPFAMVIPLPIRDYLYPQWFPQGGGTFTLSGEDIVLDRKTWVVEREKELDFTKAWIDKQTGVILKYTQQVAGIPFLEVEFTSIKFDIPIDNDIFSPTIGYVPEIER